MAVNHIVGKLPDKTILATIDALEAEFGTQHKSYRYGDVEFPLEEVEKLKGRKKPTYFISEAMYLAPERIVTVQVLRVVNGLPNAYYDQIVITPNNNGKTLTAPQAIRLEEIIRSIVTFPDPSPPSDDAEVVGILQKQIAALGDLHNSMIAEVAEARHKLEEEYSGNRAQLEQARFASESEIVQKEEDSLERIREREAELNEKLKEFDVSDHMRARRQLRENISTQVEGFLMRPVISGFRTSKFLAVVFICFAASIGAGLFAFESFQAFISTSNSPGSQATTSTPYLLWMLATRGVVLTAVCIGFAAYLVSMMRRSYDEDVRAQRELQRYGMDINRASWVIETAMEMTTKEGATLPDRWVEGAVAGLFQYGAKADSDGGSLAALGAIMGLGPEVSVGPGGASFKIPPKAAKQAAKDN